VLLPDACLQADDGNRGEKLRRSARELCQLRARAGRIARFAEHGIAQGANLVRSDHQCARMTLRHGAGLGQGQALCEGRRGLTGQADFLDLGSLAVEWQAEPAEQFAAVTRGGRKPDRAGAGVG